MYGQSWEQLGAGVYGKDAGDNEGTAVDFSVLEKTVVTGSPGDDAAASNAGSAGVYTWDGSSWRQKGSVIEGDSADDYAGSSVSLSATGEVVAVGIPRSDENGSNAGKVRIYSWNDTAWVQRGMDFNGDAGFDYFGTAVDLNANGNAIAIGAPSNDGNGIDAGQVKVYSWEDSSWTQRGMDIQGQTDEELSGQAVNLNSAGDVVAIGAPRNSDSANQAGQVRVYRWNGSSWNQEGGGLNGLDANNRAGTSVSLDAAGEIVAIGAPLNSDTASNTGHVRVYTWDGTTWNQRGSDIYGIGGDEGGRSVALNANGNSLAVGFPGNDSGKAKIYDWDGVAWNQKGRNVKGEAAVDNFGISVALDSSGSWLAAGAPENGSNGTGAGKTSVYSYCTSTSSSFSDTGCTSYTVPSGDETYSIDTTVQDTIFNAAGCDSVMTINVTIEGNSSSTISRTTCGPYTVPSGDEQYLMPGTYQDTIPNSAGCDSIITINLSGNNSDTVLHPVVCNSYTVPSGDETHTQSGTYTDTIPNAANCDSLITIELTIQKNSRDTIDTTLCANTYTVPSGGETYDSSGIYNDTIPNTAGCDSIINIDLTLLETDTVEIDTALCGYSFTVPSGDTTYTSGGTYYDTLYNSTGCDSILTLNVAMNSTYDTLDVTSCGQYTAPSGDTTYYDAGTYMDTIPNSAGCDSVLTINLTLDNTDTSFSRTVCDGSYTVPSGDTTFNSTDSTYQLTYVDTLDNAVNCDSIITIGISFRNNTSSTQEIMTCHSFTVPSGDTTYHESGTYNDTISNSAGCDSILTINLTIDTVNTAVVKIDSNSGDQDTLMAQAREATYQWLDCEDNYAQIRNENDSLFATEIEGLYAVEVQENECTDTSDCFQLSSVSGIIQNDFGTALEVYPNPTSGHITVKLGKVYQHVRASLINGSGKRTQGYSFDSKEQMDLNIKGDAGLYLLEIETSSGKKAVVRVIKR